jgi:hypothetical protein
MVEHVHFDRAGKFADHPLDFGVINFAHFVGVVKICDCRLLTRNRKALAVERQLAHDRAGAVNRHGEPGVGARTRGDARRRLEVVAHGMLVFVGEVVEHAADVVGIAGGCVFRMRCRHWESTPAIFACATAARAAGQGGARTTKMPVFGGCQNFATS